MNNRPGRRPVVRRLPRTGLPGGLISAAGGALLVVAGFLGWLRTATETGGRTTVSGFGSIGGDNTLVGGNLNDLLASSGLGGYRPGLVGLILGIIAIPTGIAVALRRPAVNRPFRVAGVLLALVGLIGSGWGCYRGLAPGTAGVLAAGDSTAAAGPWVTAGGGLLVLIAAGWLLVGRADPDDTDLPLRHRGIQS